MVLEEVEHAVSVEVIGIVEERRGITHLREVVELSFARQDSLQGRVELRRRAVPCRRRSGIGGLTITTRIPRAFASSISAENSPE